MLRTVTPTITYCPLTIEVLQRLADGKRVGGTDDERRWQRAAGAGVDLEHGDVRLRVEAAIGILCGRTQIQVDAAGVVAAV